MKGKVKEKTETCAFRLEMFASILVKYLRILATLQHTISQTWTHAHTSTQTHKRINKHTHTAGDVSLGKGKICNTLQICLIIIVIIKICHIGLCVQTRSLLTLHNIRNRNLWRHQSSHSAAVKSSKITYTQKSQSNSLPSPARRPEITSQCDRLGNESLRSGWNGAKAAAAEGILRRRADFIASTAPSKATLTDISAAGGLSYFSVEKIFEKT